MFALAVLLASAGVAPHVTHPVRAEATVTVRIERPVTISASLLSTSPANWRETTVHLPDGTIEQVRVVDLP